MLFIFKHWPKKKGFNVIYNCTRINKISYKKHINLNTQHTILCILIDNIPMVLSVCLWLIQGFIFGIEELFMVVILGLEHKVKTVMRCLWIIVVYFTARWCQGAFAIQSLPRILPLSYMCRFVVRIFLKYKNLPYNKSFI